MSHRHGNFGPNLIIIISLSSCNGLPRGGRLKNSNPHFYFILGQYQNNSLTIKCFGCGITAPEPKLFIFNFSILYDSQFEYGRQYEDHMR